MISDQFRRDYKTMTAQGVKFTPEDIVRLNALSVKVSLSRNAAGTVHLPRLAFLGKLVLREPTVAHELWIEEASRWIDCRDDRNFLWLNGYALSQRAEKLPDATNPKKVIRTVYGFASKRLCGFTTAQLKAAVTYALVGNDWWNGETGGSADKVEREGVSSSPTIGLLVDAKALRLPITVDEANRMTASELYEIINRSVAFDEKFDPDRAHQRAFGAYVRAREEIRSRQATR